MLARRARRPATSQTRPGAVEWSPDGRYLLYTVNSSASTRALAAYDVKTRAERVIATSIEPYFGVSADGAWIAMPHASLVTRRWKSSLISTATGETRPIATTQVTVFLRAPDRVDPDGANVIVRRLKQGEKNQMRQR